MDEGSGIAVKARNAARTKERLVDAALQEFAAKGYSGARTAGIGARAGVNPQLISYYFGGKQGLLDELRRRWAEVEATLARPGMSFLEGVAGYLDATLDNPEWSKLVLWQALGDAAGDTPEQGERLRAAVAGTGRRQEAGELRGDLEPGFVLLLGFVLAFAPLALPRVVEGVFGIDPLSPEYRRLCLDQLERVVR